MKGKVINVHEIEVTVIMHHALKQWRLPFLKVNKKKMLACSPEYQMNNNTSNFLDES